MNASVPTKENIISTIESNLNKIKMLGVRRLGLFGSLHHIFDEAEYIIEQTKGLSKDEFVRDGTLKRAFVRSL